ncbi:hypothetical protein TrispH2_004724 [Trichoplax sp. H2]|nr:hypothetical protein TrispH2_004724 [Trichoplax sp. H2]|eukprot:RDD43802.1 hypothetical protein TrispH2_004724 [Trichoplax sp. H2]
MVIDDETDNQQSNEIQTKSTMGKEPISDGQQPLNNGDQANYYQRLQSQLQNQGAQDGIDLQAIFQSESLDFKSADDVLSEFKDDNYVIERKEEPIQHHSPTPSSNIDHDQNQPAKNDDLNDFYQDDAYQDNIKQNNHAYAEDQYEDDFEELIEEAETENQRMITKKQSQDIVEQADLHPTQHVVEETITQQHTTPLGENGEASQPVVEEIITQQHTTPLGENGEASQPVVEEIVTQQYQAPLGDDGSVKPSSVENLRQTSPSHQVEIDIQPDKGSIHDDHYSHHSDVNIAKDNTNQDEVNFHSHDTINSNRSSPIPTHLNQDDKEEKDKNDQHSIRSNSSSHHGIVEKRQNDEQENCPTIHIEQVDGQQHESNDDDLIKSENLIQSEVNQPDAENKNDISEQSVSSSSQDEEMNRLRELLDRNKATMVQQHDQMLLDMDNKLREKDAEIEQLKGLLEKHNLEEASEQQYRLLQYEKQVEQKDNEIQQLKSLLDELKQDVNYTELIHLREQANRANALTVQQEYLSRQITEFTEMELYLRAQLEELQTKLDVTNRENTSLSNKLKEYKQGDEVKNQKIVEMEDELASINDEVQRLQNIVSEAASKGRRKSLGKSSRIDHSVPQPAPTEKKVSHQSKDQRNEQSNSRFCSVM